MGATPTTSSCANEKHELRKKREDEDLLFQWVEHKACTRIVCAVIWQCRVANEDLRDHLTVRERVERKGKRRSKRQRRCTQAG